MKGQGRRTRKAYCIQGTYGARFEHKGICGELQVQVLVVNDVIVIALIVTLKLTSADFKAHIAQVRKHAAERAKCRAAAADGGIAQMILKMTVTISYPLGVPMFGLERLSIFRGKNNWLR